LGKGKSRGWKMPTARRSFRRYVSRSITHFEWLASYADYFLRKAEGRDDQIADAIREYSVKLLAAYDALMRIAEVFTWKRR